MMGRQTDKTPEVMVVRRISDAGGRQVSTLWTVDKTIL